MRKVLTGVVLTAFLAFVGTAAADAPVHFSNSATQTTPVPNFSCVPFGYAFGALATFSVERDYTQFYDGATLVKEIRHVKFDGTLYRSDDLAKTIPYAGTWTRTWYPLENLVINTGLFRYSHPDGSGMVTLDAGAIPMEAGWSPSTPGERSSSARLRSRSSPTPGRPSSTGSRTSAPTSPPEKSIPQPTGAPSLYGLRNRLGAALAAPNPLRSLLRGGGADVGAGLASRLISRVAASVLVLRSSVSPAEHGPSSRDVRPSPSGARGLWGTQFPGPLPLIRLTAA
jgi:hypothetical protein